MFNRLNFYKKNFISSSLENGSSTQYCVYLTLSPHSTTQGTIFFVIKHQIISTVMKPVMSSTCSCSCCCGCCCSSCCCSCCSSVVVVVLDVVVAVLAVVVVVVVIVVPVVVVVVVILYSLCYVLCVLELSTWSTNHTTSHQPWPTYCVTSFVDLCDLTSYVSQRTRLVACSFSIRDKVWEFLGIF